MKVVNLNPGDLHVATQPTRITTLLGSCVAVCIFDKKKGYGGANHFMLPRPGLGAADATSNKYAVNAIPNLLSGFKKNGSKQEDLIAKIVGGGNVIDTIHSTNDIDVGHANIDIALKLLEHYQIPIVGRHVGCLHGLKISFDSTTGELRHQPIQHISNTATAQPVRVLIIEDSASMRLLLRQLIESDPGFKVVGEAENPIVADKLREKITADVATLDLRMPVMDGDVWLKNLAPQNRIPCIIISAYTVDENARIIDALGKGAVDHLPKPSMQNLEEYRGTLLQALRVAATNGKRTRTKTDLTSRVQFNASRETLQHTLIAIGASTGGTEALREVLCALPKEIPPIVIVQHIPPIFSRAFAERLDSLCAFRVKEAEHEEVVQAGTAYVTPGDKHMNLIDTAGIIRIHLTNDPPVNKFRPSVDYMFFSLEKILLRRRNLHTIGVILTGMGCDGAAGMLALRKNGTNTIAQDEASCVVFGMPREAIHLNAIMNVEPLTAIPQRIAQIINALAYKNRVA